MSQRHAGWIALTDMYDDGGISGGTMERPALMRLLDHIKAHKVNVVVVYKVDRLTRSLADFAKIVEILDDHDASFVSVTQAFNTTSSMGRLTLNMLLSFAQFEREIASERIRDKIAASKRKGMWMGGSVALGYDAKERKLVVNEAEAETVRLIFRRYAELGSVALLRNDLDRRGIVSKRRNDRSGRCEGGKRFSHGALYLILKNRLYRGEIVHQGAAYPGQHDAIVDLDLWLLVQDKLAANRYERSMGAGASDPSLLAGLIVDGNGDPMTPTHANKSGKRYRYYVSGPLLKKDKDAQFGLRVPAGDVESLALDRLRALFSSETEVGNALAHFDLDARELEVMLDRSKHIATSWLTRSPLELRVLARSVIEQVTVETNRITLRVSRAKLLIAFQDGTSGVHKQNPDADPLVLTIDASLRRAGKEKRFVIGDSAPGAADPRLTKLIADARTARNKLLSGSDHNVKAMASRRGMNRRYLTSLIRLSWLAPHIVRAILEGRHPIDLTPAQLLMASQDLPYDWAEQKRFLGFSAA